MVLGTGIDIIETKRLQKSVDKYGEHFLNHVFTRHEQDCAPPNAKSQINYFAGRWAAKEAVAKALGTGFCDKCAWLDIDIHNNDVGKPVVQLSGTAADTAAALGITSIHISISHDIAYACAMAIAEGNPPPP